MKSLSCKKGKDDSGKCRLSAHLGSGKSRGFGTWLIQIPISLLVAIGYCVHASTPLYLRSGVIILIPEDETSTGKLLCIMMRAQSCHSWDAGQ